MTDIPKQLKNLKFCRVLKGTKKAFEEAWPTKPYSYEEISKFFPKENYGVICGYQDLAVIDCDKEELKLAVEQLLPKTFSVKTGGGGTHFYYFIPELKKKIILNVGEKHIGEIQSYGAQIVGSGSLHPNGKTYEVIDNVGITTIGFELLKEVLGNFMERDEVILEKKEDIEDYKNLIKEIVKVWKEGDRQELALSVSGYLRKEKRMGINKVKSIIKQVCEITKDEELKMRLRTVDETYKKDEKDIKGFTGLGKVDLEKGGKEVKKIEIERPKSGRLISKFAEEISDILKDENILFYRPDSKDIVEVGKLKVHSTGKKVYTGFISIKPSRFITLLEKYITPIDFVYNRQLGIVETKEKSIGSELSKTILSSQILQQALPQITRIFTIPLPIIYKGKLTFPKKGYDLRFGSWLPHDAPEISDPDMKLKKAKEILDFIYKEFCWKGKQDVINTISGLLTPFLKGLFTKFNVRTPIFFYIGNREGVGKDYCAGITGIVYEGSPIEELPISSGGRDRYGSNEELRKKILAALIGGRKRLHYSNNKGFLNNAVLEQVAVTPYFEDRLLGKNELVRFDNELDFSLSGNMGITYTPDFARRCRIVRLFYDKEDVNKRVFENPNLHKWVLENRGLILSAIYSLIRNWVEKGCPAGKVAFASFPEWANVCGGIMKSAEYDSPCVADKETLNIGGDSETTDMKGLFEICHEKKADTPLTKSEIIDLIEKEDIFTYLDFEKNPDRASFGRKIVKFAGRVLSGIRMEVIDSSVRTARQKYIFTKEEVDEGGPAETPDKEDSDKVVGLVRNGRFQPIIKPKQKQSENIVGENLPNLPNLPKKEDNSKENTTKNNEKGLSDIDFSKSGIKEELEDE